jgi:hypothetical protein
MAVVMAGPSRKTLGNNQVQSMAVVMVGPSRKTLGNDQVQSICGYGWAQ